MEKLKIVRISGLMFIDIEIWSVEDNSYRDMSILLDTGASVTTKSEFILEGLGYLDCGKDITVTTAGGTIKVQAKNIDRIKIGSMEIEDVKVYAHVFPDECFSKGILGMNILEQFNFTVNLDENIIELEKRK